MEELESQTDSMTEGQRKTFFKLATRLNIENAKEKAKEKFGVESFNDITKTQMSKMIDKMVNKVEDESKRSLIELLKLHIPTTFPKNIKPVDDQTYPEYIGEQIMEYFMVTPKNK